MSDDKRRRDLVAGLRAEEGPDYAEGFVVGIDDERRRIRRTIAPALRELNRYFRSKKGFETGDWWHQAITTIDQATKPTKRPGAGKAKR
jgi:hypothetical protein